MPTVAWPSELPQVLDGDGFSFQMGPMTTSTQMQNGPRKVRRKFTKPVDVVSGKIRITYDLYNVLQTFYRTTTDGGVNPFTMTHPIHGTEYTFMFLSEPSGSHVGGNVFEVNLTLEVMP